MTTLAQAILLVLSSGAFTLSLYWAHSEKWLLAWLDMFFALMLLVIAIRADLAVVEDERNGDAKTESKA